MQLTPGKLQGLRAVSNEQGIIAAAAMDQRTSLRKALAPRNSNQDFVEFKAAVTEVLTRHASAILLETEFGLPAAGVRHPGSGLLLAYEKPGFDSSRPGRLLTLASGVSVRRLQGLGADAIKLLLHYSPADSVAINQHKQAWVERVGAECVANDIPFFLEVMSYHEGLDEKSLAYARLRPQIIHQIMQEFSQPQYHADVLKLEVPVNLRFVERTMAFCGEAAYTRAEALEHFRRSNEVCRIPFIYLSAGVSNAEFCETLELAGESGARYSGVLCGRATWADGIPIYVEKGLAAFREWLEVDGVQNIANVNAALKSATPWTSIYRV